MVDERVLRSALPGDLAALLALTQAFSRHFGYPHAEAEKSAALSQLLAEPALGRAWFVLTPDGKSAAPDGDIAGYVLLSFSFSLERGGRTGIVDELFILPSHRGSGLGAAALRRVIDTARNWGLRALQLEAEHSNPRASALYRRLGFVDQERHLLTKMID